MRFKSQLGRAILIRRELTDAQWARIEQLVPGKEGDKGRHGRNVGRISPDSETFGDQRLFAYELPKHRHAPSAGLAAWGDVQEK
jgi:hypothetical protein